MSQRDQEKAWIRKALMGDGESFEALVFSCQTKAYNLALRYMRNPEDAADALQESMLKVYRNLKGFKGESSFDTWVYRIVVNTCNDMLKKRNNRAEVQTSVQQYDTELVREIPDGRAASPEEALLQKEEGGRILRCLDLLPEEYRVILILRDVQGFAYEEISRILDCNPGTVKSRISRARQRFRELYTGLER